MDTSTIEPGVGVGDVKLGASPEAILARLGPPEETDDSSTSATWYYLARGLSLNFEALGGRWLLRSIDASGDDVTLGGTAAMGATRERAEEIASRAGLRDGEWSGDPAVDSWLEFDDGDTSFWFSAGKLVEISLETPAAQREDWPRLTPLPAPYTVPGATEGSGVRPRRRMNDRVAMAVCAVTALFLALLAVGGVNGAIAEKRAQHAMAGWPVADGRVVRVLSDRDDDGDDAYRAVVSYEVDGKPYEATESSTQSRPSHRVGARLAVRYPPGAPAEARVVGDEVGRFRATLVVAIVCGLGALAFALGTALVLRSGRA